MNIYLAWHWACACELKVNVLSVHMYLSKCVSKWSMWWWCQSTHINLSNKICEISHNEDNEMKKSHESSINFYGFTWMLHVLLDVCWYFCLQILFKKEKWVPLSEKMYADCKMLVKGVLFLFFCFSTCKNEKFNVMVLWLSIGCHEIMQIVL